MLGSVRKPEWPAVLLAAALLTCLAAAAASAQRIDPRRGADPRLDYASLTQVGPWDDRNYQLTREDLEVLAPNELELRDPIPAFFRVWMRRANPGMAKDGPAQYPRSALQIFILKFGGYLIDGKYYSKATIRDGRFEVILREGLSEAEVAQRALSGDVRVTSPTGGAESAVKIHPLDANQVVAGSNGPGSGQRMHYSTNGGTTWTQAPALPLGSTCCDPTVDWSSDGTLAYTATLGGCGAVCNVWFYRSGDGGQTWNDLEDLTPGDPRREITAANTSDKEYIHVDKFATSPFRDNIYVTWHDNNVLKFSRSTNFGSTFSSPLTLSSGSAESGIGSDIATDKNGNVYYFWPAFNSERILVKKSTNGGTSFGSTVQVAVTQDGYDFAIPAMETRRAFIYVAADADLTSGPFANRIYAAWTDTTANESGTPANNHGRIQVGFSADGGATWSLRTPHETADQNTVDRFHPWLAVGPDGTVYVVFYDTRRDPSRVAVDLFYSSSSDGGNSWATPIRLTSVISPQIDTSFEWGDYNGLDVVASQLIGVFTDNRNETGGTTDSVDIYAAGLLVGGGPGNTPPVVTITAPADGSSFTLGTPITFTGTATDAEDGNISASLTWTSSLDGAIGTGGSFSTSSLSVGAHTITASATDSGSLTGNDSIGVTITSGTVTVTFTSTGSQDGRIWESTENAEVGGGFNSTDTGTASIRVGDWSDDTQYKSIVSFNTASLPDGATVVSAVLRLRRGTSSGTNPFTTHGTCTVDVATGFFGTSASVAAADWQAAASASGVAAMSNPTANLAWSEGALNAAGRAAINKTGTTQFKVYMTLGDNDDLGIDYIGFYPGEAAAANDPQLVVVYQ